MQGEGMKHRSARQTLRDKPCDNYNCHLFKRLLYCLLRIMYASSAHRICMFVYTVLRLKTHKILHLELRFEFIWNYACIECARESVIPWVVLRSL